jgi:hypothetical protein
MFDCVDDDTRVQVLAVSHDEDDSLVDAVV